SSVCVWRLTLPVNHAARIATTFGTEALYDWGGSQVFLPMVAADVEQHATTLRAMVGEAGGSAVLMRAPVQLRAKVGVFQPRAPALESLSERIRQMFDPNGILNPGKLGAFSARSSQR
ncbi:MAG TPA: FAD-linked oxidase C-terminal domain-containing protein, partial [Steroidobacteraceae bacterium]